MTAKQVFQKGDIINSHKIPEIYPATLPQVVSHRVQLYENYPVKGVARRISDKIEELDFAETGVIPLEGDISPGSVYVSPIPVGYKLQNHVKLASSTRSQTRKQRLRTERQNGKNNKIKC